MLLIKLFTFKEGNREGQELRLREGLNAKDLSPESLQIGDELIIKLDPSNQFDPDAVLIFKGELEIGYIKKIHCKVFHKPGAKNLKIFVSGY